VKNKYPSGFSLSIQIAVFAAISIALIISFAIVLIFQITLAPDMELRENLNTSKIPQFIITNSFPGLLREIITIESQRQGETIQ